MQPKGEEKKIDQQNKMQRSKKKRKKEEENRSLMNGSQICRIKSKINLKNLIRK